MQFNSIIKFGGLAFDVASDEKVRQLAGMVHNGARRRGFFSPPPLNPGSAAQTPPSHWPKSASPIPFAPGTSSNSAPAKKESPKPEPASPNAPTPTDGWDVGKWVNMDNAKKVAGWIGTFNQILNKE